MAESLKNKAFKGTLWSAVERFSVQGVLFIIMIIMARLLTPHDYGLVGMITIFIAISTSLVDGGFSQALVRKQIGNEVDYNTAFYFNIVIGGLLYVILYLTAPIIARFYNEPMLIPLTRAICIIIVLNSFAVVQRAILLINIDFKTQAKASIIATVISGGIGITMAYTGYGVWAIVAQQLSNSATNVVILWILSHWRPKVIYSISSFHELFSFGSKLALSGLIDTIYKNIYLLVIGKIFKASDLGYYTRANQFSEFPAVSMTSIIQRVSYPVLCKIHDDESKLRILYRKFIRISGFIIFPFMMVIAGISKPLVTLILNNQWAYTGVLLPILCFSMMWYPIHAINLSLLQVKGRSDLFLKVEIYKKIIGITIMVITIPFGIKVMCYGTIATSIISLIINTYYTKKIINVGLILQLRDLLPSLLYSLSLFLVVYLCSILIPDTIQSVTIGLSVGILYFFIITRITKSKDLTEIMELIRDFRKKKL